MKNPENKPLSIIYQGMSPDVEPGTYALVLSNLAIAESNLVRAGKDSALPHFIAIVKELEDVCGFRFVVQE